MVLGSILKNWNKKFTLFELRLDKQSEFFIPIFGGTKFSGIKKVNSLYLFFFQTSTFRCKLDIFSITYQNCRIVTPRPLKKFKKTHRREVRSTAACNLRCHATTVHFLAAIDRESVLPPIFRGLCDVWSTLKSATFVTDECNASSLGPAERVGCRANS